MAYLHHLCMNSCTDYDEDAIDNYANGTEIFNAKRLCALCVEHLKSTIGYGAGTSKGDGNPPAGTQPDAVAHVEERPASPETSPSKTLAQVRLTYGVYIVLLLF